MIDVRDMRQVSKTADPHRSHKFSYPETVTVSCASEDRFGSMLTCKGCGGREVFAGGPGSHYFDPKLLKPCTKRK